MPTPTWRLRPASVPASRTLRTADSAAVAWDVDDAGGLARPLPVLIPRLRQTWWWEADRNSGQASALSGADLWSAGDAAVAYGVVGVRTGSRRRRRAPAALRPPGVEVLGPVASSTPGTPKNDV